MTKPDMPNNMDNFWSELVKAAARFELNDFLNLEPEFKLLWSEYGPNKWNPVVCGDGTVRISTSVREKGGVIQLEEHIQLRSFIHHLQLLRGLASCEGAKTLRTSLKNPQQISATFFEIRCAMGIVKKLDFSQLTFSPPVLVGGSTKHPDFKITHEGKEFFCECKSMASINRILNSRARKLCGAIRTALNSLIIPTDRRLEILFEILPSHFNDNLGEHIKGGFQTLLSRDSNRIVELNFTDVKGSVQICIQPQNSPIQLTGSLNFGFKGSEPAYKEDAKIVIAERYETLKDALRKSIADAITQIPKEGQGIVFIEPIHSQDIKNAVKEIISQNKHPNLVGVVLCFENEISIVCQPHWTPILRKIIGAPS